MKRISPGTVTIGVIAILFGLLTAYAVRHYFGRPPMPGPKRQMATVVVPVSSPQPTSAAPGCKDCQKKQRAPGPAAQQIQPGTAARNVPTLAPPQDGSSLAAGGWFERGPRGQVIYVQVEAEAATPQRN